jgi:MtN3 and saliva related transmembrane protein
MPILSFETFGILANILLVGSYIPQYLKILRTKKGEDISITMWIVIVTGDIFSLIYALSRMDVIFSSLFGLFIFENFILIYLAYKHRPKKNKKH